MKRSKPIPADLMATSSKVSPRLPKVADRGKQHGEGECQGHQRRAQINRSGERMVMPSIPLPTKSSIHSQKNCRINTNKVRKNVAMKGPINAFRTSMSVF